MSVPRMPFPYFGGKSRIAPQVWAALGDIDNYIEPFCGSAAVALARPRTIRTVLNDIDGFVVNALRSIAYRPDETARWADWPMSEADLHARHAWLVERRDELAARLEGDPQYCDPQAAGYWIWGQGTSCTPGTWCRANGPWHVVDGKLQRTGEPGGITRGIPNNGPQGVNVGLPQWMATDTYELGDRLRPRFRALANRLADVTILRGHWARAVSHAYLFTKYDGSEITGAFFDPPYSTDRRTKNLYGNDSCDLTELRAWCRDNASPNVRIILAGYRGEHDELLDYGWTTHHWVATGGFGKAAQANRFEETLWLSPHCVLERQQTLFDAVPDVAVTPDPTVDPVPVPDGPPGDGDTAI